MNDVKIIRYMNVNGREYGVFLVNDILIIQNEIDYKAIIHANDKNVDECLTFVTDETINKIKEALKNYNGQNK